MDRKKKQSMFQTYRRFMETGLNNNESIALHTFVDEKVFGFGTAVDEKIFGIKEIKKLVKNQKKQSKGLDIKWKSKPVFRYITTDENSAVFADDVHLSIRAGTDTVKMYIRFSVVLHCSNAQWKVIHWHGSKPEQVESEKDTWGVENWKEKATELQRLVDERTTDLIEKNRELEIETALERTRTRSLMMQHSDELLNVSKVFNEQLLLLGIDSAFSFVWLPNENKGDHLFWATWMEERDGNKQFHTRAITYPLDMTEPYTATCFVDWQSGIPVLEHYITPEKIDTFFASWTELLEGAERLKPAYFPDGIYYTEAFMKHGCFGIDTRRPLSLQEKDILHRFAIEFERSYTRFLDLQKAETQAREAQMEAALERIRSKITIMQESSELLDIVVAMRSEFVALSHDAGYFWYMRWLPEKYEKVMTSGDGSRIGMVMELPRHIHGNIPLIANWEKSEEPAVVYAMDVEAAVDYVDKMIRLGDFKQVDHNAPTLDDIRHIGGLTFIMARTIHGEIGYSLTGVVPNPPTEDVATLVRFAAVFDLAYRRFEDLKSAEKQIRETQIELALERVRARTMAMQRSDELAEASFLLDTQVRSLGIPTWGCAFNIYGDNESSEWFSSGAGTLPTYKTPREDCFLRYYNAGQRGEQLYIEEFAGADCAAHYDYLCTIPVVGDALKGILEAGGSFPERQIDHVAFFKYGYLLFITLDPAPDANEVFIRFAKVFEQTYNRFLDLQKAEAQARESQIEAALEKVRSESLAMHHSDELEMVAASLFDQLAELGMSFDGALIFLFDKEKRKIRLWVATNQLSTPVNIELPYDKEIENNAIIKDLWHAIQSDENILDRSYSGETKNEYFRYVAKYNESKIPEPIRQLQIEAESWKFHGVAEKNSMLGFDSWSDHVTSPEDLKILTRFAKVFEQAYIRFLDLQKAEAQAREARIEASLEKVRSRAMAMHSSQELKEVALELRTQMGLAEQDELEVCAIHLYDESPDYFESWAAIRPPHLEGKLVEVQEKFPKRGIRIVEEMMQQYHSGKKDYVLLNEGKKVPEWLEQLKEKVPDGYEMVIQNLKGRRPEDSCAYWSIADFQGGALVMTTFIPPMEEARQLLRRFANVFELAYRRFVELTQAEAQAREAKIEASLERVRSRAMAMHNTQDLSDTIHAFYKELQTFSITPRRCGVGLLDKESRTGDLFTWNTTEQGESLELVGRLLMEGHPVLEKVYEGWITQTDYYPVLRGEEINEYYKVIRPQMGFPDYAHDAVQYGYFFFFSEGGVYAWTQNEMKEEELQIYRRFTSVLSLTYKRYKDLQQAETLAEKAEQDLILLKEEKKRTEEALAELQVTQRQLIQSEKMASLGELTAGIAHEIQNPLNFVNNFSEVNAELIDELAQQIDSGNTNEIITLIKDIRENEQKINHHGKRADAIVKGMLQHSRSSSGTKEPTDINALCDEYLRLTYHGLRARDKSFNASIKTDFDCSIGKIEVTPQDLGRAILNLLTNAFYTVTEKKKSGSMTDSANAYEPTVSVRTKRGKEAIEIEVSDNGNGIPQKILDKIFQPFFTTKPTGQGTGLGLSLSYEIITKGHGGELKVETTENKGTSFIIKIPFKPSLHENLSS